MAVYLRLFEKKRNLTSKKEETISHKVSLKIRILAFVSIRRWTQKILAVLNILLSLVCKRESFCKDIESLRSSSLREGAKLRRTPSKIVQFIVKIHSWMKRVSYALVEKVSEQQSSKTLSIQLSCQEEII